MKSLKISLKNFAAICSISVALMLTIIKTIAAMLTGSLSVLSSLVDSLSDVFSSFISLIAVFYSEKPLTDQHRYGYGKAESVSALLQAAFIACSAGFILYDGIHRFIYPTLIKETPLGIAVMIICLIITIGLVAFQKYVIKRTNSQAIAADSVHYVVDILSNSSVILSLIIVRYCEWLWFDILVAVLIAVYLIFNAWQLAVNALEEITDRELSVDIKKDIMRLAMSVDGIKGCHDLRSRVSGNHWFVEIHLEFDGNKSLYETHLLSDLAEDKIVKKYPQIQLIVHQDPYGIVENRIDHSIERVNGL